MRIEAVLRNCCDLQFHASNVQIDAHDRSKLLMKHPSSPSHGSAGCARRCDCPATRRVLIWIYRHTLSPLVDIIAATCDLFVYGDEAIERFGLWAGDG